MGCRMLPLSIVVSCHVHSVSSLDYYALRDMSSHNPVVAQRQMWKEVLQRQVAGEEDAGRRVAVDMTCGKGFDTLSLAREMDGGELWAFDVQPQAIRMTEQLLRADGMLSRPELSVRLCNRSHDDLPEDLTALEGTVDLCAYNLGYLPGTDKNVATQPRSTLESLRKALRLVRPTGLITVMAYPGHDMGQREYEALRRFAAEGLDPHEWCANVFEQLNREETPRLLAFVRRR